MVAGGKGAVEAAKDAERSSGGGEGRESCRRCASSRRSARDCLDSRGCGEKGGERAVRRRATDEFSRRGLRRRWVRSAKRTLADKPKWRGDESENTVRSAGQASTRRVRATASESFRLALTLASRGTKGRSTERISTSRGCELAHNDCPRLPSCVDGLAPAGSSDERGAAARSSRAALRLPQIVFARSPPSQ